MKVSNKYNQRYFVYLVLCVTSLCLAIPVEARQQRAPSITIELPNTTQRPLRPPSKIVDKDGDFIVVGTELREIAPFDNIGGFTTVPACQSVVKASGKVHARIVDYWDSEKEMMAVRIDTNLSNGKVHPALYRTQIHTENLLMYAEYQRDISLLDDLAKLYKHAFDGIGTYDSQLIYYVLNADGSEPRQSEHVFDQPVRLWTSFPDDGFSVGTEQMLSSSQFLHASSRLTRVVSEMGGKATQEMREFAEVAFEVGLVDHYERWVFANKGTPGVFETRGWGCDHGNRSHQEHLQSLLNNELGSRMRNVGKKPLSYCNAVTDTDLWMIAGVAELLLAHYQDPQSFPIAKPRLNDFELYMELAQQLLSSRLSVSTVGDEKVKVTSLNFDLGSWDDYKDYRYAAYEGETFPGWVKPDGPNAIEPQPGVNVGWDISHARRFVAVFESMARYQKVNGSGFPTSEQRLQIVRQLAFGAWNGNTVTPSFTNYMDGSNGWYRVNYDDRTGSGFKPWSGTHSAVTGGYGFWSEFVPGLRNVLVTANEQLTLSDLDLLTALPSLQEYHSENVCGW